MAISVELTFGPKDLPASEGLCGDVEADRRTADVARESLSRILLRCRVGGGLGLIRFGGQVACVDHAA